MTNATPLSFHFDAPNPHGQPGTHRLTFYRWGDTSLPPLLCVHGLTRNGRDFDYLARALCHRFQVVAVDIAGRGKSDPLPNPEWYDNGVYMQDVLALAERLNFQQFDYIGTSMGGMIGMMIAAFLPGKITRMVLNDVGAAISRTALERIAGYVGKQVMFLSRTEAEATLRVLMQPFGIQEEAHWQHVFDHSLVPLDNGRVTLAYDPAITANFGKALALLGDASELSLWKIWEAVTCPTLILRGAQSDLLTHETAQTMCAMHKNANLIEFSGVGHAPALMDEEQISAVEEWLAQ